MRCIYKVVKNYTQVQCGLFLQPDVVDIFLFHINSSIHTLHDKGPLEVVNFCC